MGNSDPITLTFLMTDIKGSTGLWERYPQVMLSVIAEHDRIIERAVSETGGRIVRERGEGDSHFAIYEHPADAAKGALQIHLGLAEASWPEGINIEVRIAIHMGETHRRDADFYGIPVNRCARIREAAHGGQTLVSRSVALALQSSEEPFRLVDLGLHRLRDLLQSEYLFQLGDERVFPPIRSLTFLRNNLPHQQTSFVGREEDLERVKSALSRHQLTTLVGPGGSGKTRLALQVAAESAEGRDGGTWLVELAALETQSQILAHLGRVLGFLPDETVDLLELICSQLRPASALLVFDNCERVLKAVGSIVGRIAHECPNVRVLTTSREPLGLVGESVIRIPTLQVPEPTETSVAEIGKADAVRLFVERAQLRNDSFDLTASNATTVASICRRLDGIPLAIEQAAAMVSYMGPSQILERLSDRFSVLISEESDALPRHRTLETTIDWSFDLLSADEQALFVGLSIFPDSFSLQGLEAIASGVGIPASKAAWTGKKLVDKSLLNTLECYDQIRYRMLDTVREYALRRGHDDGESIEAFLEYAVARAVGASEPYRGYQQEVHLAELDMDLATFRRALELLYNGEDERLGEVAYGLRRYWMRRGHLAEGRLWLSRAVERCTSAVSRAGLENALGAFCWQLGLSEAARDHFSNGLDLWEEIGDENEVAAVSTNLALLLDDMGETTAALDAYDRSISVFRRKRDRVKLRIALHNYGFTLLELGRYEEANRSLREALEITESEDDALGAASVCGAIGELCLRQNDFREAAAFLARSLRHWRGLADPKQTAVTLISCSSLLLAQKRMDEAATLFAGAEQSLGSSGSELDPRLQARVGTVRAQLSSIAAEPVASAVRTGRGMNLDQLLELGYCALDQLFHQADGKRV